MCVWLTLSAVTLAAGTPAADNWPAFRGHGDAVSDAKLPTEWSETKNVRWKTPVHGKGWSSPVVWGDRVWLTTADEKRTGKPQPVPGKGGLTSDVVGVTFYAVCVDLKSGKVVHDTALATDPDPAFVHDFNSYASPTPVVEEGRVYAHFGAHGTWCLDAGTGKSVWERRDLRCDHHRGPGSSPVLHGGLLILIFDGFDVQYVVALDKRTGETVWKKNRAIPYKTSDGDFKKAYATARVVEVGGKPQLVCPSAEQTVAYDPATGAELWRLTHGGMNGSARPVAGHGLVYLTSGHTRQLIAVRQGVSGEVPRDAVAWQAGKIVPTRSSLLLVGDLLFMVSDDGIASCLDAKTGKVHWSERLGGEYTASPVAAGGYVYFPNQSGKTTVVKAAKEYEPVAVNELAAGCMASPAVAGDALLLRTRTHLYSIAPK
ncbi:MAG: PQQ-binding-like beta-propeller repeat protein [Gemmataceae bacterium]|nr:PQQ-binding-like beta-propeller repeat protein [Gemmataceae bacterium]